MIVIGQSLKNLEDVPIRRPSTYFVTTFEIFMSKDLPNELYTMQAVICHRVAITQDKSDLQKPYKNPKDVPM